MKLLGTNEKVNLLHYGFDICIIQLSDGKQKMVKPEDIGLNRRVRPSTLIKQQEKKWR